MKQATLFGKPKEEIQEATEEEKYIPEEETETTDENGWGDYDHQEILNNKAEGYCYHHLQLMTRSNLDGISYSISQSSTYEMPKNFMGSSYGGGGKFDLENPKEYFDTLMKHKLEAQKEPYKKLSEEIWKMDHHNGSDFYRLVLLKNYIVIIGKKLKEMLKEKGFDFEEWYKKYRAIEENPASDEYNKIVLAAKELLFKGSNLIKKANLIKQSIKYKLGQRNNYGESIQDYHKETGVDELLKQLKEIASEVFTLNKELVDKYYRKLYRDGYEVFSSKRITEVLS